MLKEFKEFAVKGNMIDMAVGITRGCLHGTIHGVQVGTTHILASGTIQDSTSPCTFLKSAAK